MVVDHRCPGRVLPFSSGRYGCVLEGVPRVCLGFVSQPTAAPKPTGTTIGTQSHPPTASVLRSTALTLRTQCW